MQNQEQNNNDNKNNFFNQNPLITFAIFSVVIILLFRGLVGEGNANLNSNMQRKTQQVSYSELKNLVSTKNVSQVNIGQSYIRAISSDGSTV